MRRVASLEITCGGTKRAGRQGAPEFRRRVDAGNTSHNVGLPGVAARALARTDPVLLNRLNTLLLMGEECSGFSLMF